MDYLEMVRQNWRNLGQVPGPEQTPEICMAAVQQKGSVLEYVKEQTPNICVVAIQQKEDAIEYGKMKLWKK